MKSCVQRTVWTNYPLGEQLQSVESAKDVGVTINYKVSWGKHVSYIVNKENKV